ncbi:hypothetical protein BC629DRAFT_866184 [Irpex lacteus]|nr:hypothetical protein BC629DRAFT_866184 [Irpex lacteus]
MFTVAGRKVPRILVFGNPAFDWISKELSDTLEVMKKWKNVSSSTYFSKSYGVCGQRYRRHTMGDGNRYCFSTLHPVPR